jgi:O-acetyl-ADP-ribose deacetylase (regulator of RNase III)
MALNDLQFRGLTLHFVQGDLLSRTDEGIVISCDRQFDLNGGLGRAFKRAGGQQFVQAVDQIKANPPDTSAPCAVSVPASGTLQCNHVILVPLRRIFMHQMENVFTSIFQCAIQMGIQRLVMPTIGLGGFQMQAAAVSTALREAFESIQNYAPLTVRLF